ncbi:MAG: type I restriction enzyme HsdR N-terminal domain-containing protein [Bacteroidales bacterium]|nr:type I restriction enzyme HsdR N-terminal domain-containing protein [Bacteroidales bacterium]
MISLNFPEYDFRIAEKNGKRSIFDPVRKKYVALTPEEWVRQHVIRYLAEEKKVPLSLIRAESEIRLYQTRKRFDLAVYDRNGQAVAVVECKATNVRVTQEVLDQAVRYNLARRVKYLMLTTGLQHVFCRMDMNDGSISLIQDLPEYPDLV